MKSYSSSMPPKRSACCRMASLTVRNRTSFFARRSSWASPPLPGCSSIRHAGPKPAEWLPRESLEPAPTGVLESSVTHSIGTRFVEAVAAQDASAIAAASPPVSRFGAHPSGLRERTGAEEAAALVAGWFADSTELHLVESRTEEVSDRLHVAYRFEGVEDDEPYVVEQHLFCALPAASLNARICSVPAFGLATEA